MNLEGLDHLLRRLGSKWVVVTFVVLAGVLWIVFYAMVDDSETAPVADAGASLQGERAGGASAGSLSGRDFGREDESDSAGEERRRQRAGDESSALALEQSVLRARNLSAKRVLAEAESALQEFESAAAEWERLVDSLENGQLGRVLAADTESLPSLMELLSVGSEQANDPPGYREQFDLVSGEVEKFLAGDRVTAVTGATLRAIETLRDEIRERERALQGSLDRLKLAARDARGSQPGEMTLEEAYEAYRAQQAEQARLREIAARERVRKEAEERIEEAEREKLEAKTALEVAKQAAEADRMRREKEMLEIAAAKEKEEADAKLAQERLETEFTRDLPEIRRLLSPFVSPAPYYLSRPGSYLYSGQSTGLSLSTVAKSGALEPTDEGIDMMSMLGKAPYRPLGSFPKYVQSEWRRTESVKRRLVRAQELLLKYGDLLVEKGMMEK